ncbi:putative porin [Flavobacterium sp. UBA4197]|uniref:putative porin n=1 Tax=Flavobacterium sp. UBA4197 TaxID=1946546 RepID=UPI002580D443|nr:putative porin [Flavobacterium sp. UBA4197]
MKHLFLTVFFFCSLSMLGQEQLDTIKPRKSLRVSDEKKHVAPINQYKIISLEKDTTYVDTSLTIKKEYALNYLRKDIFGLMPFANEGQTYNTLDYGLTSYNAYPEFGFKAKHFAYMRAEDIKYYSMPTPMTELYYKSVMEQGQNLDAFLSLNTSKNFNMSVGYKGLRSLGKYVNQLSSTGNFRFITSYHTTDNRYNLKMHFAVQDILNHENGGVKNLSDFENSIPPYDDRARLDVYFSDDTKSSLEGKRIFIDHSFRLNKDNPNSLVFMHQLNYEYKFFNYAQPTANERFGSAYSSSVNNKTRFNSIYNKIGVAYSNQLFGDFQFYLEEYKYNYFYNNTVLNSDGTIAVPNAQNDKIDSYGAQYSYYKGKWKGTLLLSNSITDQSLAKVDGTVRYTLDEKNIFSFRFQTMNKLPDLNYNLYQSGYIAYNWKNNFKNEKIKNFEFEAKTKWFDAAAKYTILDDHLYFVNNSQNETQILVTPTQYNNTINYFSARIGREFKVGKFGLDNTFLYQKVEQSDRILNVPELVARNTLYFNDYYFSKALYLQMGVTLNYFSKYYANDYHPLLGEFYIQEKKQIGNFPLLDFFINAKIRQTRIYLKAEHFNSSFTGYNFYSDTNNPYHDFMIRFGLVWNFFS